MTNKTSREIIYGNDLFQEIITPISGYTLKITYWDLWIAIILVNQFDNNLDKMINRLRSTANKSNSLIEGLLNHIRLLNQTLSEENLHIADILTGSDADFIKKQTIKAKRKILEMGFQSNEKSIWMINTPKKLREDQAMRGHWHLFPVSPDNYADLLVKLYKSSFYSKRESSSLRDKLDKNLEKYEKKASISELFALYRAFLTVIIEKFEMVDDSYGVIGDFYEEVFKKYFLLDRSKLDMKLENFFLDFIELLLWEDYGCSDHYMADFFKSLASTEMPLVKSILLQQQEELNKLELYYQAKNALSMLKMIEKIKPAI